MEIYRAQNKPSFHPDFAQNPIVQDALKVAKQSKDVAGTSLLGGLLKNGTKIAKEAQDIFIKSISEAEKEAQSILENHPKREEILDIIRMSNEELQKTKLEFLKLIKNIAMSEDESDYLLRLLDGNFTKEPLIARVWGLCMQKGLDIYTLIDSSYSIDKKCAENILNRNLLDKTSPKQALLMSHFDSDETGRRVSEYASQYGENSAPRIISEFPAHNDALTNASLDLIYRYKNLIDKSNSTSEMEIITKWRRTPVTLEDINSKNKVLDILGQRADIGSYWYYCVSSILHKTDNENISIISKIMQRNDISLQKADKIATLINKNNEEFINNLCSDKSINIEPNSIPAFIEMFNSFGRNFSNIEKMQLSEQINTLKDLQSVPAEMKPLFAKHGYDIDYHISALNKILGEKVPVVIVPSKIQQRFMSAFLSNNNFAAENILKTHDFSQYRKEGIPLKYSRKDFCKNINTILSELTEEEQNILLKHFGLKKGRKYTDGTVNFDGILNNRKFEKKNTGAEVLGAAHKISEEIEKFTVKNETLFEDTELKSFFDDVIKGFPEFTEVIGKEQYNAHEFSVDIHTLKVLQSAMNNPLYSNLSDKDKTIMKMSVLLHDLGKPGGTDDRGEHTKTSAYYAAGILEKFNLPIEVKDRITDIIQYHHWYEKYNMGLLSVEDVALRCRRPGDFEIYQIMAKADLENVNKYFHLGHKSGGAKTQEEFDKYFEEKMKPIELALNQLYSRHNHVFYTEFVGNGKLFPVEKIKIDKDIVELRVLDLNKLPDNASLERYGFPPGTTKENVRFLVHMTRPNTANLESVIRLTQNRLNHSTWSASVIKPSDNVTYENYKFGFAFHADQANFADAFFENIASGNCKTLEDFRDILFGKILRYDNTKLGIDLTQEERQQLNKIIMGKGYLQNINEDIVIGDKTINKKQIFEACGGDSWLYLRNILLENLKKEGFELTDNEYADLTKFLITKKFLTQITKTNLKGELTGKPIKIGRHSIPAGTLVDCLNKSLDRLFEDNKRVQSEVITFDPVPVAFMALADSLNECHPDFLVTAKKYKDTIPVIIQKDSRCSGA